jgi:hypothetical protein
VLAQPLHVGDQMLGCVVPHVGGGVAGLWGAAAAAALVEQDQLVTRRVEGPVPAAEEATARAAVHDDRGLAARGAADLPVHLVSVADVEHALVVGLGHWIALGHARSFCGVGISL